MMTIPKAFISYSHDTLDHKKWVLDLATRLRASGVDAVLDQWDLQPGDDLAHFMETQLTAADRVLMICTDKYVEKANAGTGGVGYEKMIVTASALRRIDSNKVIPIVRQIGNAKLPTFLQTKLYLDFSSTEQAEYSFDELVRTLHNAPLYEKPPITTSPFPTNPKPARPTNDGILQVMEIAVNLFESSTNKWHNYSELVGHSKISRIMLDIYFEECKTQGLLIENNYQYGKFGLTNKGKRFAIENQLVQ
jgi:predicted transcriptional regulator